MSKYRIYTALFIAAVMAIIGYAAVKMVSVELDKQFNGLLDELSFETVLAENIG